MARGPEQEDAFLHLPAAQAVPAAAQEDCYADLVGRSLLPFPEEGLCATAGAETGLPEPVLPAGIKSGRRWGAGNVLLSPRGQGRPGQGRARRGGRPNRLCCSGAGGDAAAGRAAG